MPSAPLPALPVVFRPIRTRVVLLSVGFSMFLVLGVIAVILERLNSGERVTFVVTGFLFLAVLALLSRPHIRADAEGVTVVNLTRTRRLAWAEILRVNLRAGDPWVFLDLADGTSQAAMGIQPGIEAKRAIADAVTLRQLVEHYGTGQDTRP